MTAIHGDRSQQQREEALSAFKSGANPVPAPVRMLAPPPIISDIAGRAVACDIRWQASGGCVRKDPP